MQQRQQQRKYDWWRRQQLLHQLNHSRGLPSQTWKNTSLQLIKRGFGERLERSLARPGANMSEHTPEMKNMRTEGGWRQGAVDVGNSIMNFANKFKNTEYKGAVFTWKETEKHWRSRVYVHVNKVFDPNKNRFVGGMYWREATQKEAREFLGIKDQRGHLNRN